jgi:hypothetical protein
VYFITLCGLLSNWGRALEVAVMIRAVSYSYFRGVRRFILCKVVNKPQCIQHKFLSQSSVLANKSDPALNLLGVGLRSGSNLIQVSHTSART